MEFLYVKVQVFKLLPPVAVEFLLTEIGANGLSTE